MKHLIYSYEWTCPDDGDDGEWHEATLAIPEEFEPEAYIAGFTAGIPQFRDDVEFRNWIPEPHLQLFVADVVMKLEDCDYNLEWDFFTETRELAEAELNDRMSGRRNELFTVAIATLR